MSRAPTCAHPDCVEPVVRTGSRGPWPNCCPDHRRDRRREQARARVRKHRGTQWVLARFESDRNADRELREYSIVNLDLACERVFPPRSFGDRGQTWLDERATFWIENGPELETRDRLAVATAEDRAMLAAASRDRVELRIPVRTPYLPPAAPEAEDKSREAA